ncbi:hypothetical protein CYMTET_7585 [Cymbomonas tetramitiformis]|uniref:Uncharacterized protein n=1 Tax=Cymbomonas tetramitiformis TaxID=36881 RepID=A0AAE0GUZ9_9CHLO|nr:hypothetical protein CYMTET_7585 [Cymbomonas tetramitiformis]
MFSRCVSFSSRSHKAAPSLPQNCSFNSTIARKGYTGLRRGDFTGFVRFAPKQRSVRPCASNRDFEGVDDSDDEDDIDREWMEFGFFDEECRELDDDKGWGALSTDWWTDLSDFTDAPAVHVLLFGVGTSQEGVYSVQRKSECGMPDDTILAFAGKSDAERYASLLTSQMGQIPIVEALSPEKLIEFCKTAGFKCRVVGRSAVMLGLFTPPKQTLQMTDWERACRLRQGHYGVTHEEQEGVNCAQATTEQPDKTLQDAELDQLKMQLEDLYHR